MNCGKWFKINTLPILLRGVPLNGMAGTKRRAAILPHLSGIVRPDCKRLRQGFSRLAGLCMSGAPGRRHVATTGA
jgi:hypothetical protein